MRSASAKVTKSNRSGGGSGGFGGGGGGGGFSGGQGGGGQGGGGQGSSRPNDDPWASSDSGGDNSFSDEPPF
jgi:single-strand DNA-binding protein